MKISYNWLKQYIQCELPAEELGKTLTGTGLEVEDITRYESVKGGLKGVVVGKVLTCVEHPNSDHLHITTVDVGNEEPLHIVCGAPNVATGQKVLVATIGCELWKGEESFTIKKGKIRGEVSEGMICAEDELQLGESHDGIMVLPDDYEVGKPASFYFPVEEDFTYEIGLTANRSDATSHIGCDRDIVAALNHKNNTREYKIIKPSVDDYKTDNTDNNIEVVVEDTDRCPRYSGVTVSGIKVGQSPAWLRHRLEAAGLRSINNIVDISNFVLMEVGQPLHIFDADKIKGNKVIVKCIDKDTMFTTLDGVERKITDEDLMICNSEEPMCIAGVFGGLESGVTETTTNIFIESAYFNPTSIRKTARRHALQTDASFRYERGCDPNVTIYALKRAALLVKELAGGTISSEIKDVVNADFTPTRVVLKFDYLNKIAGQEIEKDTAVNILSDLECKVVERTDEYVTVDVPTCKVDVYRPADLVEEILRIYGYDNIAIPSKINASLNVNNKPDAEKLQEHISIMLAANGFNEIMNNSLTKSAYTRELESFNEEKNIKILNPLSSDLDVMRQSLMFGGLESIARNQNFKRSNMKFFEFGNTYTFNKENTQTEEKPLNPYSENFRLDMLLTGNDKEESWNEKPRSITFYDLKRYVIGVIHKLGINTEEIQMREGDAQHYDYSIVYSVNGNDIATLGKLSQKTLKIFDIKKDVFHATLDWDAIMKIIKNLNTISFRALPKFPSVRRDLALVLDKGITFEQIKKVALSADKNILKSVSLFDIYEGDKIPAGKKQYAISFILQDTQKTLTDKVIEKTMAKIQSSIEQQLNATLR
ncbi:MAG: phenylalanine--tRNA ligase subunit beta [Candidatus Limimorpha sp.]